MIGRSSLLVVILFVYSCTDPAVAPGDQPPVGQDSIPASIAADTLASFSWDSELCNNTGTYDPRKYTAEQLKNTYDLWFTTRGVQLHSAVSVYEPQDISRLNLAAMTKEYQQKKARYQQMTLIDAPFWHTLKEQAMQQLEDEYEMEKMLAQAFTDPSVLQNNRFSQSCATFVTALNASDTSVLLAAWKAMTEERKSKNGSPEAYMARFYEKYNSPQKLAFARVDLLTFGWGNCANDMIFHVEDDGKQEEEFNKLFTNVKSICDEP